MPTRFMHIADIHLGYSQYGLDERYNDLYDSFAQAMTDARREGVDFVIIAGDLFHSRSISPRTLAQAMHELEQMKSANIPVVAVMGNHEQAHYNDNFSWLSLLALQRLVILLRMHYTQEDHRLVLEPAREGMGAYIDIRGVRLYGMQYAGSYQARLLADLAETLPRLHTPHRPAISILVLHAGLEGIIPNIGAAVRREDLSPLRDEVDYVAFGHLHKPFQEDDWIHNPGSLEPISFPEAQYEGGALLVEMTPGSRPVVEKRVYRQRPFRTFSLNVTPYQSPDDLYTAVEDHLHRETLHFKKRPVIQYILSGMLRFDRRALDMQRIEKTVSSACNALHVRIENRTAATEYEITAGDSHINRAELEGLIFNDLFARDGRYRDRSREYASLTSELKRLVLAKTPPHVILERLREGLQHLQETPAIP